MTNSRSGQGDIPARIYEGMSPKEEATIFANVVAGSGGFEGVMVHADNNYRTKKALNNAFHQKERVGVHQPGPFGPSVDNGNVVIEGPHEQHKWYANAVVKDGVVIVLEGKEPNHRYVKS